MATQVTARTAVTEEDRAKRILKVAGRLFAEKGYAATSTTEIASEVGIRQPTLYHYFPGKQWILKAILDEILRAPAEMARRVTASGDAPEVKLYRLLRYNVLLICTSPYRVGEIAWLREVRGEAFEGFWNGRRALVALYRRLIEECIQAGLFRRLDAQMAALDLNGSSEGVINWKGQSDAEPASIAEFVADRALSGLLADRGELERIRRTALAYADPTPFTGDA